MNILIPDSWLREYIETDATAPEIKNYLSLCGPSVERLIIDGSETIYDIEVTTNRVDCACVIGIAREAAAILPRFGKKATLKIPDSRFRIQDSKSFPLSITVATDLVFRLMAVVIENVDLQKSPELIKKRLAQVGINSINNTVDITNYVMTEIGHPTHVFDFDLIKDREFVIRKAKKGERIVDLHGTKFTLAGGETVIDDGTGTIIDLPGIIGTKNSVVNENTKNVLFFMEANDPVHIRKTSMNLGIRTMAATLNEKGIDPELTPVALTRGIELFEEITKGTAQKELFDYYPNPYQEKTVSVTKKKAFSYLSKELTDIEIKDLLKPLGFKTTLSKTDIQVRVPSFRANDITIPEDIIEELARLTGYHTLTPALPVTVELPIPSSAFFSFEHRLKTLLSDWGHTEIYSYSFVSVSEAKASGYALEEHVTIANPLNNEQRCMRRSLIPSLLTVVGENQARKDNLLLFESAHIYHPTRRGELPDEFPVLTIVSQESFQNLKGVVEGIFSFFGVNAQFEKGTHPVFHPNQTAQISVNKEVVGHIGTVTPRIQNSFGIKKPVFACEIALEKLLSHIPDSKRFTPINEHPPILIDLSLTFPKETYIGKVIEHIKNSNSLIYEVLLLEQYQNVSTFRIMFQDPRGNLKKETVNPIREKIITSVAKHFSGAIKEA